MKITHQQYFPGKYCACGCMQRHAIGHKHASAHPLILTGKVRGHTRARGIDSLRLCPREALRDRGES